MKLLCALMRRCCRSGLSAQFSTLCFHRVNRFGQRDGAGAEHSPETVQMYLPSASALHGWEKKLFSSAFRAREIINKLIIY